MIKCIGQVVPLSPFSQEEKAHYKKGIMASISEGPNLFFVPVPMHCVAILSGIYLVTKMNGYLIRGLASSLLIEVNFYGKIQRKDLQGAWRETFQFPLPRCSSIIFIRKTGRPRDKNRLPKS